MSIHDASTHVQPPFTIARIEGELMAVNSFIVQGPDGVIVVDGQLTVGDATKVQTAVAATGRPLAGVIITHPHPDHYAGAGIIAGDAPVIATTEVHGIIARDDEEKSAIVGGMMGDQWPARRRLPDHLVAAGSTVDLAGLRLRVTDSGPGESYVDTLWWLDDRTLFLGDVAYNDMHAYLADAQHHAWLASLSALEAQLPADASLHLGHGPTATTQVLGAQRRYITTFLATIEAHAAADPGTRQAAVIDAMRTLVDDDRLQFLMELSIEPVHQALTRSAV